MDFFAERSDLLSELNLVRSVVEKRNTIPILSHFLLEAEGFELKITATDLEVAVRTVCQAKVRTKGVAVVPGLRFLEIVRSAANGEIRCRALENHWVQVTYGRSAFKLAGLAKDDFPKFPAIPKPIAQIDPGMLAECAEKTSFVISQEESRYLLNGALLKLKSDSMTSAQISKDKSNVFFCVGSRTLASRLLTGEFPNYEAILPKENGKVAELNREEFEGVVRRVSLLADDRVRGVRLALVKDRLEVSASSPEYGEARESVETRYGQEALQIGFNAQYLLDFLNAVRAAASIRMQVKNGESAVEFRPSGNDGEHYRYVLMPLRF